MKICDNLDIISFFVYFWLIEVFFWFLIEKNNKNIKKKFNKYIDKII